MRVRPAPFDARAGKRRRRCVSIDSPGAKSFIFRRISPPRAKLSRARNNQPLAACSIDPDFMSSLSGTGISKYRSFANDAQNTRFAGRAFCFPVQLIECRAMK
ncbi:hypothetical protein [Burkholderia thailandensis]|uniref:hypothetical protein n=1 Tax=Burkholderia thailandensis TaxID=57975 RepID=UPI0012DA74D6|nr:hypothetical protein [Burkholderia thailandensis]